MSEQKRIDRLKQNEKKKKSAERFLKLGTFLPIGKLFGTNYNRDFSAAASPEPSGKYLRPQEYFDADEDSLFDKIKKAFASDILAEPAGSGKSQPDFQDLHWGHTTGMLQGSLTIDKKHLLPDQFQQGLFAHDRTYPLICRPNFLYDDDPVIAISRISFKLRYPEPVPNVYSPTGTAHELDLLMSEGLRQALHNDQDGQGFFFRDARQMLMAGDLKGGKAAAMRIMLNSASGKVLVKWKKIFDHNTDSLYGSEQRSRGWAGKHYFSAGPYALGNGLMKFSLEPLQDHPVDAPDPVIENPAVFHKKTLQDWIKSGKKAEFNLLVQVATTDSIPQPGTGDPPKEIMAAEYTDLVWDENKAPFVAVGKLTLDGFMEDQTDPWYLPTDDRWASTESTSPESTSVQSTTVQSNQHSNRNYAIRFNAWNTFNETRPMGQLFRARKMVHGFHREQRLGHSFLDQPQAGTKCPFSGDQS